MKILKGNYGQAILKPNEEIEQNYGGIVVANISDKKLIEATILDITPIYNFFYSCSA